MNNNLQTVRSMLCFRRERIQTYNFGQVRRKPLASLRFPNRLSGGIPLFSQVHSRTVVLSSALLSEPKACGSYHSIPPRTYWQWNQVRPLAKESGENGQHPLALIAVAPVSLREKTSVGQGVSLREDGRIEATNRLHTGSTEDEHALFKGLPSSLRNLTNR